jgi:hypothetical protein
VRTFAFAVLLLFVCSTAGAAVPASGPSFSLSRQYRTAKWPESVAVGDLNGDGSLDLVAAHGLNYELHAVSVLLNRGDGTFRRAHVYPTARPGDRAGTWSVAVGDLNGDGTLDLAAANPEDRSVSVLINRGEGTFRPSIRYPIAHQPSDVAVEDLNGDGKRDIVTANPNSVSVLFNAGDGTYRQLDLAAGRNTDALAVGDLDGDRRPDLATSNYRTSNVSVFLNAGGGEFYPKADYPVGPGPNSIAIGDLDGDDRPELVTANGTRAPESDWFDSVSVLRNRGDGGFRRARLYPFRPYNFNRQEFSSVAIGDLNGDRRRDVALAAAASHARLVSVLVNRGNATLGSRLTYGPEGGDYAGSGTRAIALGDLNGDGRLDVVTPVRHSLSVLVNRPGRCAVQDVRQRTLRDARRVLAEASCRVGSIRRTYSLLTPRGKVAAQRPAGGSVLPGGGKVNLVVSRGKRFS